MTATPSGLSLLLVISTLAGCSGPRSREAAAPTEAIHLTARLVPPADVVLEWKDSAPHAAGHIAEFATEPSGEFTILAFLLPHENVFKHADLMPETNWYYRVRAIYGPASESVEITLPSKLSDAAYATRFDRPENYYWAIPRIAPDLSKTPTTSIRSTSTAADAAPTGLKAALVGSTVSGFHLTWTDRASDEEGLLLETKPAGGSDFTVCALLAPDINSFGFRLVPPERTAAFRVRAFYYGQPSNLAHAVTGPEPSAGHSRPTAVPGH